MVCNIRLDIPPKLDVIIVPPAKDGQSYNPCYGIKVVEIRQSVCLVDFPWHIVWVTHATTSEVYTRFVMGMIMLMPYLKYSKAFSPVLTDPVARGVVVVATLTKSTTNEPPPP